MRFISLIDNPFSRVEPTCPSVRIEIKLFPIVSDGVYWTTLTSRTSRKTMVTSGSICSSRVMVFFSEIK